MTAIHEQSLRIVTRKNALHQTIRRTIIAKAMIAALLVCVPVQASDLLAPGKISTSQKASPGSALSRNSLQDTHAEKVNAQADIRNQRTAGTAPLSSAMVLSLALGLRTAQGPMVRTEKPERAASSPTLKSSSSGGSGGRVYDKLASER